MNYLNALKGSLLTLSLLTSTALFGNPLVIAANQQASAAPQNQPGSFEETMKEAFKKFSELKWVQVLPVENLVMMESPGGDYVLIDTKSRIAIRGEVEVYDIWNQRRIKTLDDAKRSWLVNLARFDIKDGDLATYKFGLKKETPDMRAFVDPTSVHNLVLFEQMKALADKYAFEITLAPMLTRDSIAPAISIWCNNDQEQSLRHLMSGESFQSHVYATCDKSPILKSLGVLQLLNVKKVPYVLRADGIHSQGAPTDLAKFMSQDTFATIPDTPVEK